MSRRILLFGAVLLLACSSLLAERERALATPSSGLVIGPPHDVAPPLLRAAYGYQGWPRIAAGDEGFLALWYDTRSGADTPMLYATILDAYGSVRIPAGLALGLVGGAFDVTWAGDRYMAVWDGYDSAGRIGIYVAAISRDGEILAGPNRIGAPEMIPESFRIAALADGTVYVVPFSEYYGPVETLTSYLLDLNASVVRTRPLQMYSVTRDGVTLASSGDRFLLVRADQNSSGWRIQPLDSSGAIVHDTLLRVERLRFDHPSLAWSGSGYVLVWTEEGDLRSAALAADGTPTGTATTLVPGPEGANVRGSSIAWRGGSYVVAYEKQVGTIPCFPACDNRLFEVRSMVLDDAGVPIAGTDHVVSTSEAEDASSPAVASLNGRSLIVWSEMTHDHESSLLGNVDGSPDVYPVAQSATIERDAVVSSSGDALAVAWIDSTDVRTSIRVKRFDGSGHLVDAEPLVAGESPQGWFYPPAIASGGGGHLVAWLAQGTYDGGWGAGLLTRTILPDGRFAEDAPVLRLHGSTGTAVAVAFDGTDFVVATSIDGNVVAQRIAPDGQLLNEQAIHYGTALIRSVAVGADSQNTIFVFNQPNGDADELWMVVASHDLSHLSLTLVANGPGYQMTPSIASDGRLTGFLAWTREMRRNDGTVYNSQIFGTRIRNGAAIDGDARTNRIAIYPYDVQRAPRVEWNGTDFEIAFFNTQRYDELLVGLANANAPIPAYTGVPVVSIGKFPASETLRSVARSSSGVRLLASDAISLSAGNVRRTFVRVISKTLRRRAIAR